MMLTFPQKILLIREGIIFLAYILICARLAECRFSKKAGLFAAGGILSGVVLLQTALLLSGLETVFVFTLLPITAYLPAAAGLYVLSRRDFMQTTAVFTVGVMSVFLLKNIGVVFSQHLKSALKLLDWQNDIIATAVVLIVAGLLLYFVFRFLSAPFRAYIKENRKNWMYIFLPVLILLLLFSYFKNSTKDVTVWFLLLLTAASVFIVAVRLLVSSVAVLRMKEAEQEVEFKMQMQRQEYEDMCQKMEAGSIYRHDMRHHLIVLEELAKQENSESILAYLEDMNGRLSDTGREVYCENITANAVLSSCIGRAKKAGCSVSAEINLPEEIPFDDIDVCMVLANAIENAANACQDIQDKKKRYIHIAVKFLEQQKLLVSVENPCERNLSFDRDGYPAVPNSKGHGIGLKSIHAITDKYNGCFRCEYSEGEFRFYAAMFYTQEAPVLLKEEHNNFWKKFTSNVPVSIAAFFTLASCVILIAQIFLKVPEQRGIASTAENHVQAFGWGDTIFQAEYPVFAQDHTAAGKQEKTDQGVAEEEPLKDQAAAKQEYFTGNNVEQEEYSTYTDDWGRTFPTYSATAGGTPSKNSTADGGESQKKDTGTGKKNSKNNKNAGKEPDNDNTDKDKETENDKNKDKKPGKDNEDKKPSTVNNDEDKKPPTEDSTGNEKPPVDISAGMEDLNNQIDKYIEEIKKKFLWYVARKYDGYVGVDTDYKILRDDKSLLVVQFFSTINAGGSGQYSRSFTLDKSSGKILELKDLFLENSDYRGVISKDILRQMKERMQKGEGNYFIPGGIWSEDECFKKIAEDQNFYINNQNQLVIMFDEYEVAPGFMGMPEFEIDTRILGTILQKPSVLR